MQWINCWTTKKGSFKKEDKPIWECVFAQSLGKKACTCQTKKYWDAIDKHFGSNKHCEREIPISFEKSYEKVTKSILEFSTSIT